MAMRIAWCLFWLTLCVITLVMSISEHWGAGYVAWAGANLGVWIGLTVAVLKEDR